MSAHPQATEAGAPAIPREQDGVFLRVVDAVTETVLLVALVGELGAIVINVLGRNFLNASFLWTDEIAQLALSIITFVGGTVAYRRREHAFVRAALNRFPDRLHRACLAFADLLVLMISAVSVISSLSFLEISWDQVTPVLHMPAAWTVLPLTVSMALLAIYAGEHLLRQSRMMALLLGALLAIFITAAIITRELWLPWFSGDTAIIVSLLLFLIAIVAGLPVGFALLLSTATYIWTANAAPMVALPQNMVAGTTNFVLLALPFFIIAGLVMERGGISLRLVRFVHTLVGHLRSGLLQVMVVSMYFVSGLSGSKSADVAAVGTVMRAMLKRERYSLSEGTAVLSASAAMGECIPPSIAMLVLGSITKLSMVALFLAGLVPAAVIAVCIMILVYIRARLANTPRSPRAPMHTLLRAGIGAVLPMFMPVMLFAGILLGVATPTEVSAFAVVYGVVLAAVGYRELDFRGFVRTIIDSGALAGMVLFILAAASSFSWALTVAYVPQRLVELLHGVNNSTIIFLVGSIALMIIVGSLLEGFPALNVLAPLLVPVAAQIGVSELHYGIVIIVAVGIGAFIPPAGVGFYICCAIMHTRIEEASRAMIPYLVCLIIGLLIVSFVPWLTLVVPRAVGLGG